MKIFIDPGHNHSLTPTGRSTDRFDTGAQGNGLREQDVTFEVAWRLRDVLVRAGIEVRMSRNAITDNVGNLLSESINGRARMANDFGADYFISLHTDWFSNATARGSHVIIRQFGNAAEPMARAIQKQLLALGLDGRSQQIVARTDLGVLNQTKMPALLVEMGFISNARDAAIQRDRAGDLARAIADGIFETLGINEGEIMEHWAQKYLNGLIAKGIIDTPEAWTDFDTPPTKGMLLALADKITDRFSNK